MSESNIDLTLSVSQSEQYPHGHSAVLPKLTAEQKWDELRRYYTHMRDFAYRELDKNPSNSEMARVGGLYGEVVLIMGNIEETGTVDGSDR